MSFAMRSGSRGFTLIELLVVLVILAAVAGLVLPKLGYVEDQAGNATAAAATGQVLSNLEIYKTSTGSYPLGLDTLLEGTSTSATGIYQRLFNHTSSGGNFGTRNYLTMSTLTSLEAQSFGHAFSPNGTTGQYTFYNHDGTTTDASNSATNARNIFTATGFSVAVVDPTYTSTSVPVNPLIKAAGYVNGTIPSGVRLVAFGVGPNTGSIGATMISAPSHSESSSTTYGRFIAVFAVYADGRPTQLKTVVDSQCVPVSQNITDYRNAAPEHD